MSEAILEKVRKINWVLQEAPKGDFSFNDLCKILSDLTNANVYLANVRGKILGVHYKIESDKNLVSNPDGGAESFNSSEREAFLNISETRANLQGEAVKEIFADGESTSSKYHTIIPVVGGGQRWGTLILARYEPEFSDEDIALSEVGATVVGLEIQRVKSIEEEEENRQKEIVRMAISTLSYSENEAVKRIFEELDGEEGILVASKIADRSRITRSVIVNALRKLESAGVIESTSLGMKGTHIRVLNSKFYPELGKLEK